MFCFLKCDWLDSIECDASVNKKKRKSKLKPAGDKLPLTVRKIT